MKKTLYYLGLFFAGLIIIASIGLYSLPLANPYLQNHRKQIENIVSNLMHYKIKVDGVRIERRGINPEIQLHNITIHDAKFDNLYIGINLISSLFNGRLMANYLVLSGAKLNLYQGKTFDWHVEKEAAMFIPEHVYLQNVYLVWHSKNGGVIVCPDLKLQVIKDFGGRKIVAMGNLIKKHTTQFKLVARLHGHDLAFDKIAADGYLKLIEGDKADIEAWFGWQNKRLKKLQSRFTLRNINFRPKPDSKVIYITSLTGNIFLQQQQDNTWTLAGNYTDFVGGYGNLLQRMVKINKLQCLVNWQHAAYGWEVKIQDIIARNRDLNIYGDASIFLPSSRGLGPVIGLLANIDIKNVKHARYYYPAPLMPKELLTWLNTSIKKAKPIPGTLVWRGRLADYPFHKHNGVFLLSANINNGELKFNPDWPALENINGRMLFINDAMQIDGSADMLNLALNNVHVVISDFKKPVLSVNGKATGDNADILNLISQSPLREVIGRYTRNMQAGGPMLGNLEFTLPLGKSPGKLVINGNISETNGTLSVPDWKINLNKLAGVVYFTEDSLTAKKLTAMLFGNPATIKMNKRKDAVHIDINGTYNINEKYASGAFNYKAGVDLYKDIKHSNDFNVISNLRGLKIALPAPFGKSADELHDIYARAEFLTGKPMQIRIRYNNILSAALEFNKVLYGIVHIGKGLAKMPHQPGLFITGYLPVARWSDWKPYLTGESSVIPAQAGIQNIRKFDLIIGDLDAFNQSWKNIKIQAQPQEKSWLVNITSDKAVGKLTIPEFFPRQTLIGRFDKLYLAFANKQKSAPINPGDVPPLDIISDDFHYNNKKFNRIELKVIPRGDSMRINQLNINSPDFNLTSTGEWRIYHGSQHSSLYGTVQTSNAGNLLKNWNNTEDLSDGQGSIVFSLHWLGSIFDPNLASMSGNMLLDLKHGRILNLGKSTEQKIDIGRILNVLNPMSLSENLTGGLVKKGFGFKEMKGDFKLKNGNIYTDDTYINGNIARVSAAGRIGILAQDYDLILTMIPDVTSSLPIIAAIFGGPIIGVVTWAGNEVFKHTLQPATMSYKYRITGSWQKPKIVKIA